MNSDSTKKPSPGSWWNNEDNELIQVISDDSKLIVLTGGVVYPVNFKFWDGPRTNDTSGCTIDEFYLTWNHKFN